jgi:hypothetical protein
MRFSTFVVPLAALASLMACESSTDQAQYPPGQYPPGQYPTQQYPTQQQPTQQQPTQTAAPAGTSATPIAVAMAGPLAGIVIQGAAGNDARGMQPEGSAFAGNFQQGQTLEQSLQLEPGKCYTVVGAGGPGITELDVTIVAQPAPIIPPQVIAQDNQTGPNATLGGGGNCFRNPSPVGIPAKVVLTARSGGGMAVAQIYKK